VEGLEGVLVHILHQLLAAALEHQVKEMLGVWLIMDLGVVVVAAVQAL
jgi:hypothetical protein